MKFLNFPVLTKPLVIIGAFAVTSFLTYAVISSPGEMLVSTPYQTRNLTAEAEFSRLAGKNGMAVLDGIIAKIRAKAIAKGGDPFDAMAYDAYIDDRLSAIDALDDQIRSEIGIEYAFIFQYAYPRVLELKRNEEKVVSVLKRLGTVMNGDSSVSGDTSVSGNGGAAVPSNNSDFCKKEMKFGDLRICDTGKQAVYSEINSLCPAGFHVPNYWEMGTLLSSLAPIELEGNYYFIASLYRDTHNDPSYPFQNNPYVLKGKNSLNHTSSTYGVSGTEK